MKKFPHIIIGFVTLVICFGIYVVGSPQTARKEKIDNDKVKDLIILQNRINSFYQDNGSVPENLSELDDEYYNRDHHIDPQTNKPYEYKKTGDNTYKLCAEFLQSSYSNHSRKKHMQEWNHEAGRHCFDKQIIQNTKPALPFRIKESVIIEPQVN